MSLPEFIRAWLKGGVVTPHHKRTASAETVCMPVPAKVYLPMTQHIGAPCTPVVAVGDTVDVGQIIGDSESFSASPIHSSVSGKVVAITDLEQPNDGKTAVVVVESDGEQRVHSSVKPPVINSKGDFIRAIHQSGLVGLGGAGFPTHRKLSVPDDKPIDTLIINAAECEPYITSDYRECIENSADVMEGIHKVMDILGIRRTIIGIERNKPGAIAELSRLVAVQTTAEKEIKVNMLTTIYPQGAEKILIRSCTGRILPVDKLPADVGCLVMNVSTIAFLARYLKTGMPLVTRRITVEGAVHNPQNVYVPLGTPIADVVKFCGGYAAPVAKLLMGGPMMGTALKDDTFPVLKQNNAILVMTDSEVSTLPPGPCIRCGRCVDACPVFLVPPAIAGAYKRGDTDEIADLGVATCLECGCCSFVCPANIPVTQTMKLSKQAMYNAGKQ